MRRRNFEHTLARAETRRSGSRAHRPWLWLPALATGAVALWIVLALPGPAPDPADPSDFRPVWSMPTDVLLDVPGTALLSEVPAIGAPIEIPTPLPRTGTITDLRRILG